MVATGHMWLFKFTVKTKCIEKFLSCPSHVSSTQTRAPCGREGLPHWSPLWRIQLEMEQKSQLQVDCSEMWLYTNVFFTQAYKTLVRLFPAPFQSHWLLPFLSHSMFLPQGLHKPLAYSPPTFHPPLPLLLTRWPTGPVWPVKVPHPRKPLRPRQTRTDILPIFNLATY